MRQRINRQATKTDFPYYSEMALQVSDAARMLRELRERAGYSRAKLGDLIGMPGTTLQTYETVYKKPFQPVDLVKALLPHLVGRGDPPITNSEVAALVGANGLHFGTSFAAPQIANDLAASVESGVVVPKLDPRPGDPIHDLDEAALLGMWRRLSIVKKATLFAHLGADDMPSLRKSA